MVRYIDNGYLIGWYFCKEDCYFGDGTRKTAERLAKEMED